MVHDATGAPAARLLRRALALLALTVAVTSLWLDHAGALPPVGKRGIDVVQVEGLFDPSNQSLVLNAISQANANRSTLLILQVDSWGSIDTDIDLVVRAIDRSRVPVAVWVGPSGADAKGAAAVLVEAAHLAFVSPDSGAGPAHPVRLDDPGATSTGRVADELASLATRRGRDADGARRLATQRLGSTEAKAAGAITAVRPTIGEVIVNLDGKTVATGAGDVKLATAKVIGVGRGRHRLPNQEVRFGRLGLGDQVLHRLVNPSIAYFLLMAGFALLVFEFYTAGVGLAGVVGAVAVAGAMVGFSHLPVRWWAFGLLVLATLGFAVDVQAGGLGVWTVIGAAALAVGSLTLYGGSSQLGPPWWVLLVVCVGMLLFMLGGMTAMIRARFSTPTVGREGMVGESGTAEVAVDPDGVVVIRGARWRARTNRATPIPAGDPVRVVAVEGLVLEVEPPERGARDYRERARNRRKRDPAHDLSD